MLHKLKGRLVDVGRFETLNQLFFIVDSLNLNFKNKIIRVNILPLLGRELIIIYLLDNDKMLIINYEIDGKVFKVTEFKKVIHTLSSGGYYEVFDLSFTDYLSDTNIIRSSMLDSDANDRAFTMVYDVFRKNVINAITSNSLSDMGNHIGMSCDLGINDEMSKYISKLDNVVSNIIKSKIVRVYYIDSNTAGLLINDIRSFLKSISNGALHVVSDVIDLWLIAHEGIIGLYIKLDDRVLYGSEACHYLLSEDLYRKISLSDKKLRVVVYEFIK